MSGRVSKLVLPYPPSANRYWRTFRAGKRCVTVLSQEAKDFKAEVRRIAAGARAIHPVTGDVIVWMTVYRPRRAGDLDNRIKPTLDSLNGVAYVDDKQITRLVVDRGDDKHNPRIEVEVHEV